ncbi:MAG: C45 family autoproteolytic acyltransferase/hydrolase [Planctomycetota bacterium]|jgi:hypothetical protein
MKMAVSATIVFLRVALAAAATGTSAPARGEIAEVRGIRVLRLEGTPTERGYAHGYHLAREVMQLFNRYGGMIARDRGRYEDVIRREVRECFSFSNEVREEVAGMLAGVRASLGDAGLATFLGRPIDETDLLAVQALPDWYPLACSSFVAWGPLAPGGPVAGRNLDFFVHPVLLENHIVIVNTRSGGRGAARRAWATVTWPGLVGALTGMNEDGTVAFLHDANAPLGRAPKGCLPRMLAARRILELAGADAPARDAMALLEDTPTRWGGLIFVAGPRAGELEGAAGCLERDRSGTTLRLARADPVARDVPAFACTNHFRVRARPRACGRYATFVERLSTARAEGAAVDEAFATALMRDVAQPITLASCFFDLRARTMSVRLSRLSGRAVDSEPARLSWAELTGAAGAVGAGTR